MLSLRSGIGPGLRAWNSEIKIQEMTVLAGLLGCHPSARDSKGAKASYFEPKARTLSLRSANCKGHNSVPSHADECAKPGS